MKGERGRAFYGRPRTDLDEFVALLLHPSRRTVFDGREHQQGHDGRHTWAGYLPGGSLRTQYARRTYQHLHSVNQREAPEVLAHSSNGSSVPELGEATSGDEPRKLKVQQLRRLFAHCCATRRKRRGGNHCC